MFLALDESLGSSMETIGCLCLPQALMPQLEAGFIEGRLKNKVWAEMKWNRLCAPYVEKYKEMVGNYLAPDDVTFHSWTYTKPTSAERAQHHDGVDASRVIYRHAYMLIRTVIWKTRNSGYRGPYYILADETGKIGKEEYKTTQDILKGDSRIDPAAELEFCNTGNSTACGAMQVVDLLTGAVMSHYDTRFSKQDACTDFVEFLKALNKGVPLNFSAPSLPRLGAQKLQHNLFAPRGGTIII